MFKNLKQKIGESLENSPARNLLQGKPVSRRGHILRCGYFIMIRLHEGGALNRLHDSTSR